MKKERAQKHERLGEKRFKMPHTYVILFSIIIVMTICSYIIPAGQFERVVDEETGRTLAEAGSFHYVEQSPVGLFDLFRAVPTGMQAAAEVIFFIFIVGGSFQIITSTGAIEAGICKVAKKMQGREKVIIPIFVFLFSLLGGAIGMAEETIAFIPIGIMLARALGYDAIVGASMIILGAGAGFSSGFMNPFTVGVAQGIAELPMFSGIALRLVIWVVMVTVTSIFILRYAKKVKSDPAISFVRDLELAESDNKINIENSPKINASHIGVMLSLLIGMGIMVYGVFNFKWGMTDISTVFIIIGLAGGIIGRMGPSNIAREFAAGAKNIAFGALVVGIARGILIVMEDGMIIDTIIDTLGNLIIGLPQAVASVLMMIVQVIINFFIPSGSGQAATTMPIMAPLADIIGMTRQTAVLAFQFGDGFTNSIIPTSAALMGNLSMAKIPYEKWVRYVWPIICIWICVGAAFMIIASAINYGPY